MLLEKLIGRHLMIGIPGAKLTLETLKLFQNTHAAGLIVFRLNFESTESFKKLILELEEKLGRRLLIAVDHEGGRVIHLAEGITVFPDNWALGNTKNEFYALKQGEIEAKELRRLGIDLNLAPTMDVLTKSFSPNIGIRSYGKNPKLVSKLGVARIQAMQKNGLSACAKHFPGLGASPLDPHLELPVLSSSPEELKKIHLKPFEAAIKKGVDCLMSTHVVLPKIDPTKMPATFSKKMISGILRRKMKFQGVILTDDLEMGALRGICSIGEAAVRAVEAGHDMVLACHDRTAPFEIFKALKQAYQSGRLHLEDLKNSAQRIDQLIEKRHVRFSFGEAIPHREGEEISRLIAREGVSIRPGKEMDLEIHEKIGIIFPKISELKDRFFIEPELCQEITFLKRLCGENEIFSGPKCIYSLESFPEDVDALCESSAAVIYFCYDAHLSKGSKKILETVTQKAKQATIVLLRDPYDLEWIPKKIPVATAYGFRSMQIEEAFKKLMKYIKIRQGSLRE